MERSAAPACSVRRLWLRLPATGCIRQAAGRAAVQSRVSVRLREPETLCCDLVLCSHLGHWHKGVCAEGGTTHGTQADAGRCLLLLLRCCRRLGSQMSRSSASAPPGTAACGAMALSWAAPSRASSPRWGGGDTTAGGAGCHRGQRVSQRGGAVCGGTGTRVCHPDRCTWGSVGVCACCGAA